MLHEILPISSAYGFFLCEKAVYSDRRNRQFHKRKPEWGDNQSILLLDTWQEKTHDRHIPGRKYHKDAPVTAPVLQRRTDDRMPFRKSGGLMGALDILAELLTAHIVMQRFLQYSANVLA